MAVHFIDVEKNEYLTDNIERYTSNKVNQYAKFLDKNPIFITYFYCLVFEHRFHG